MKGQVINKKIRAFVNRPTHRKAARKGCRETRNQGYGRYLTTFSACLGASVFLSNLVTPTNLFALPQDGNVVAGSASMVRSSARLEVNQVTDKAVIDWRSFNIAADELTRFNQPSTSSMTLNRVTTGDPSSILGTLTANGRVMLVNPNGVFFGPGSRVDVGGLVATTADIADTDFMAGNLRFSLPSSVSDAAVVNQGTITVHDAGLAALVAPVVANTGIIHARLGKVALAAGNTFTLDLYGDNLVQFEVGSTVAENQAAGAESLVTNSGLISADGGTVLLTASAAGRAVGKVVNMDGIIEARAVEVGQGGEIILHGGDSGIVSVSGTLDVSGKDAGQQGGTVKVLGDKVGLFAGTVIDASGDAGGGEVLVGGDFQGANPDIKNATATYVDAAASITADGLTAGDGGKVIVWADGITRFNGKISARGGSVAGGGGFVEVSGKEGLSFTGHVSLAAPNGKAGNLLLDPDDIIVAAAGTDDLVGVPDDGNNNDYTFAEDAGAGGKTIAPGTLTAIMDDGTSVTLQAHNDITVAITGAVDASGSTTPGGGLTLQAGDDVILNAGISTNNGAVVISSGDAAATPTGKDGMGEIIMAGGVAIAAGSADITMSAEGNVSIDSLTTTGTISITSTNGSIVESGDDGGAEITATNAILTAATGVGATGAALETLVADLDVSVTGTGLINIAEADGVTLSDVDTVDGSITITSGGAMVASDVAATDGTVTLSSNGGMTATLVRALDSGATGDYDVNLGNSVSGDVLIGSVIADNGVVIDSAGSILDNSSGDGADKRIVGNAVQLIAAGAIGAVTDDLDVVTSDLVAEFGTSVYVENHTDFDSLRLVSTQAGDANEYQIAGVDLTFDVTDDGLTYLVTEVRETSADGMDFSFQGDEGIDIGIIRTGDNATVEITSTLGSILEAGDDAGAEIRATNAILTAATGVGASGAAMETRVDDLAVSVTGSGSIFIDELDDVVLSNIATADGAITISSAGLMTATDVAATDGSVTLSSNGGMTATLVRTVDSGATGAYDVNLTNNGSGDVLIETVTVDNDVDIASAGSIADSANASISVSGQGRLSAGGSIILGDTGVDSVNFGSLDATAVTLVTINEDSDMVVDGLSAASVNLASTGSITDSTGALIAVTGQGLLSAGSSITLGDTGTDSVNFGSLDATAVSAVAISEDSDMVVDGLSSTTAALSSTGSI
ncbi:MAG: filamentous hemagglutinin N-terminal domain-containing protein, partial [Pseudomonadota bacterium]